MLIGNSITPNFVIQETSLKIKYNDSGDLLDYVKNKDVFDVKDGFLNLPKLPGLGIDVDEEAVIEADKEGFAWNSCPGATSTVRW